MSNNVTLPGTGVPVESLDIGAGVERQVVTIAPRDLSGADSIGALTETAPASDTASSGINGRLQRIAQNISGLRTDTIPAGTNVIGKVDHTSTGIGHGKKTVTTAGTDVVIAASTAAKWVTVQAYRANTGYISVGASGVDAAAAGDGVQLSAGESITLPIDNLADVFVDSTVNGEGVRFTYGT